MLSIRRLAELVEGCSEFMMTKAVFQRELSMAAEMIPRDEAREKLYQQVRGLTLSVAALGTKFRLDTPTGSLHYVLVKVPDAGVEIAGRDSISIVDDPGQAQPESGVNAAEPTIASMRERLGGYASEVLVFHPGAPESLSAHKRLVRLVGTPGSSVVGSCVAALRGNQWLADWALAHHGRSLQALLLLEDSVPLVILSGDPGTGKSVTLRNLAGASSVFLGLPVVSIRLNERLRGTGIQGRAGSEVVGVFESIGQLAASSHWPIVVALDEAEAVAGHRVTSDVGSGEKENTAVLDGLVKGLDALAISGARVVVVFATNMLERIDPAIVRRAQVYAFDRPDDAARLSILDCALGDVFSEMELKELCRKTFRNDLPLTGADILNQVVQPAIRSAASASRPLTLEDVASLAEGAVATRPVVQG